MRINTRKILNEKGSTASVPAGCSIYFISNKIKSNEPSYTVVIDRKKVSVIYQSKNCFMYKSFKVCSHSLAISFTLEIFYQFIAKLNRLNSKDIISLIVNVPKRKDAGTKKQKATERRKGPTNAKIPKITAYVQPTQNDVSQQYALDFVNDTQHDAPATVIPLPKYPGPSPNC